jgi:hypothetical protein
MSIYCPVADADADAETSLSYCIPGFFDDSEPQISPTDVEISGLIDQTIPFYSKLFAQEYGDTFEKFDFLCRFHRLSCVVVHASAWAFAL